MTSRRIELLGERYVAENARIDECFGHLSRVGDRLRAASGSKEAPAWLEALRAEGRQLRDTAFDPLLLVLVAESEGELAGATQRTLVDHPVLFMYRGMPQCETLDDVEDERTWEGVTETLRRRMQTEVSAGVDELVFDVERHLRAQARVAAGHADRLEAARRRVAVTRNLLVLRESDPEMLLDGAELTLEEWSAAVARWSDRVEEETAGTDEEVERAEGERREREASLPAVEREVRATLRAVDAVRRECIDASFELGRAREGESPDDEEAASESRRIDLLHRRSADIFRPYADDAEARRDIVTRLVLLDLEPAVDAWQDGERAAGYEPEDRAVVIERVEERQEQARAYLRTLAVLDRDPEFYHLGALAEAEELLGEFRRVRDAFEDHLAARRDLEE